MSSNMQVKRICQFCQQEFMARTTVTKYCTHKCNSRAHKAKARQAKLQASHLEMVKVKESRKVDLSSQEVLNVAQAAQLLETTKKAVYKMIASGRLFAAKLSPRRIRILRCDVDALFISDTPLSDLRPFITEREFNIKDGYHMAEIQEKFGISEKALYSLIKRHHIPKYPDGWYVYVPKQTIDKLLTKIEDKDEGND